MRLDLEPEHWMRSGVWPSIVVVAFCVLLLPLIVMDTQTPENLVLSALWVLIALFTVPYIHYRIEGGHARRLSIRDHATFPVYAGGQRSAASDSPM